MIDLAWLVDDDSIFTYIMTKQMQQVSFCDRLETFSNGQLALDALRERAGDPARLPSVIFLDLNMPVMDGWQFLDTFCQLRFSRPVTIYIVSSSIDPSDHAKLHEYRCVTAFFIKPVRKEQLKEVIASYEASVKNRENKDL